MLAQSDSNLAWVLNSLWVKLSLPASDLQAELVDRDNSTQTELPTIKLELLEVVSVASI